MNSNYEDLNKSLEDCNGRVGLKKKKKKKLHGEIKG